MRIRVDNGKYTFVAEGPYTSPIEILRAGQRWIALHDGINPLRSIMAELDAARMIVQAAREIVANRPLAPFAALEAALERHAGLVDDREPPSEWTDPAPQPPERPDPYARYGKCPSCRSVDPKYFGMDKEPCADPWHEHELAKQRAGLRP